MMLRAAREYREPERLGERRIQASDEQKLKP
jgi:hypothetical protein